jgi:uncharacterized protein (DUF3820 family)
MTERELAMQMAMDLEAIERMHMPFGKFGPQHFPPQGVPIYDLPAEYLGWFAKKGFPKGRLGDLLKMVHQMKADGSDFAFDAMRKRNGGRTKLREERPREWKAGEPNPF